MKLIKQHDAAPAAAEDNDDDDIKRHRMKPPTWLSIQTKVLKKYESC